MNKPKFSKRQIALIASQVRQYKKLYVTTEGQMFVSEIDANDAVRTKNHVIDEPDDYIGIIVITEDMVSDEIIRRIAKDTGTFDRMFDGAKIPRMAKKRDDTSRKFEKPKDTSESDKELMDLLNVGAETDKAADKAADKVTDKAADKAAAVLSAPKNISK